MQPCFDKPFYVGFNIGGYELGLAPSTESGAAGPGGAVAYWGVEDIDAVVERLRRVVFLEVKTGGAPLTRRERQVRDAVEAREVEWAELRVGRQLLASD